MEFTFGICATKENIDYHPRIIESIQSLNIPKYEIIFIDNECTPPKIPGVLHATYNTFFDKPGWITKKKNMAAYYAKYENIAFLHDYIEFDSKWYEGFLKFGNDFDVCMNVVKNLDGERNLDWILYYQDMSFPNAEQLLPYDKDFTKMMYIPGFYWVAKKQFMLNNPLDERLVWGEAEDVEWSRRIRDICSFKMNPYSEVRFLKQKEYTLNEISPENLKTLEAHYEAHFK